MCGFFPPLKKKSCFHPGVCMGSEGEGGGGVARALMFTVILLHVGVYVHTRVRVCVHACAFEGVCVVLCCIVLCCVALCCVVWCGVVWCGCGVVWFNRVNLY